MARPRSSAMTVLVLCASCALLALTPGFVGLPSDAPVKKSKVSMQQQMGSNRGRAQAETLKKGPFKKEDLAEDIEAEESRRRALGMPSLKEEAENRKKWEEEEQIKTMYETTGSVDELGEYKYPYMFMCAVIMWVWIGNFYRMFGGMDFATFPPHF
mmetsp:Transcript_49360/g.127352  ORF Transcript_49360/g.127352 Transcript_49360/m.127352 type:complete len:156 (-) Transcript_49360:477-944(-)